MTNGFTVDTGKLTLEAEAFRRQATQAEAIAQRIATCRNQMRITSIFSGALKLQMHLLYTQALEDAAQMDTLAEALDEIARLYTDYENRILGNANGTPVTNTEPGEDKRNWWQIIQDWFFGDDVDTEYTHTTIEQEAAANIYMQNQIQRLYDSDRFSEETWANATVEERRAILQDFMIQAAAIMGVNVRFTTINEAPSDGLITNGWYSHSDREMAVNMYIVENYSAERSYELMSTVIHELRHAYQHAAVDNPTQYQVTQETIDAWKDNFNHYLTSEDDGYDAYRSQAVEQDARWFAGQD